VARARLHVAESRLWPGKSCNAQAGQNARGLFRVVCSILLHCSLPNSLSRDTELHRDWNKLTMCAFWFWTWEKLLCLKKIGFTKSTHMCFLITRKALLWRSRLLMSRLLTKGRAVESASWGHAGASFIQLSDTGCCISQVPSPASRSCPLRSPLMPVPLCTKRLIKCVHLSPSLGKYGFKYNSYLRHGDYLDYISNELLCSSSYFPDRHCSAILCNFRAVSKILFSWPARCS